jgi:hypothetical protein
MKVQFLNLTQKYIQYIYTINIKSRYYIFIILQIYILTLSNCSILEVKSPIYNDKNPIHIGFFDFSGVYGARNSKIIREAIFNHLIEKGYAVGIQRESSVEILENQIPSNPIELFEKEAKRLPLNRGFGSREVGLLTMDNRTVFLRGTLFSSKEQYSEANEILLYLTLCSYSGDVLQTITLNQKDIGLSKLNYIGKEIADKIANFITMETKNENK